MKMSLLTGGVLLCSFLFNFFSYAQSVESNQAHQCGFDIVHQRRIANDPEYKSRTDEFNLMVQKYVVPSNKVSQTNYKVPVVIHVMDAGNSLTNISDDEIRQGIKNLNERYRKIPGSLGDGNGVDVELEFALAVRDPNGACTNGIVRFDMTGDATYMANGVFADQSGISDAALKAYSVWDQTQYYNIWLVSEIDNNNGGSGIQGYAFFASSHGASNDGAVILANNFRNPENTTAAHEIGHAFNLHHTFNGDNDGTVCPPNSNCSTDGDLVCDTPPHIRSNSNCVVGSNACDGNSSTELFIHNYMDYSSSSCKNEFTAGQKTRVIAAMNNERASFLASNGNMSLVPPAVAVVDFSSNSAGGCTGTVIEFVDQSSCTPNTFLDTTSWPNISFNWTFDNNAGTVINSTLQNPIITFNTAGTYDVTLSITNLNGTTSYTSQGNVVITSSVLAADCNATSSYSGTLQYGIFKVQLNTLNHVSSGTYGDNLSGLTVNGYGDFSCTESTILAPNTSYDLSIEGLPYDPGNGEDFKVYIDYNNDGDFNDAGEQVLFWDNAPAPTGLLTQSFTTPVSPVLNTLLRMRVISARDSETITPCMTTSRGQVHDFGVYISDLVADVSISVAPSSTIVYGTSTTFTATPSNGGSAPVYAWYLNGVLVPGETGSTFVTSSLTDGDEVYCIMTSNLTGVIASPATSNTITMTVTGPPLSDFSANTTSICSGSTVTFTDESDLIPTSWNWSFPGGSPSSSTAQNPVITYNTPGSYAVTLTASNGNGTGTTETKNGFINVFATPTGICSSFSRSATPSSNIGIHKVKLNTIDNSTSWDDAVYNDYSCSQITELEPNTEYAISVTGGPWNNQWVRVYIDYNQNNSFADAGELVFNPANGMGTLSGTFTTPASPVLDQLLRMRVISDFVNTTPGSCTSPLQYGQVEDYGVIMTVSCVAPTQDSNPVASAICEGGNTSFGAAFNGTNLTYSWEVSTNGGGTWGTVSNGGVYSNATTSTLSISGATIGMDTYLYRCVATNACGSVNSNSAELTINAIPAISIGSLNNPSSCATLTGSIEILGSGTGDVQWSGDAVGSANGVTLPYTINGLGAGNYEISFESSGCLSNSVNTTLTDPGGVVPVISANGPTVFCEGESVQLTSSESSNNEWSTTATTQAIVVTSSGDYSVTYTDGSGCSATSDVVTVTVNPLPVAPTITASGSTTICFGSTLDLTSSEPTGNLWSTAEVNQTITISEAGDYTVQFTDANGCTSPLSSAVTITVTGENASSIPLVEGFVGNTFVPTDWSYVDNGGNGNWVRSGVVGTAPTTGNSMMFDNYNNNDVGFNDEVWIKPLNFEGAAAVELTFDVAYARYGASNSDGLEVLVSTDCGNSFSTLYSKSDLVLATDGTITSSYTPGTWRNEIVDLSAYDGEPNVIVAFRNLAGYGNNLYIDNINISGSYPPVADFNASATTVCAGEPISFTNTSTNNPTSYSWTFAGGSPASSIDENPVVTFDTPGVYSVTLIASNSAGSDDEVKTDYITVIATPSTPIVTVADNCGNSVLTTSGSNLEWSTTETTPSITVTTAGDYTVTQTVDGCTSLPGTGTASPIAIPSAPIVTVADNCGNSVLTTSGSNLEWSTTETTASITVTTAGDYTVTQTVDGCTSLPGTGTASPIAIPSAPIVTVADNCGNSVLTTSGSNLEWSTTETTPSITVTTAGDYTVTQTVDGCTSLPGTGTASPIAIPSTPIVTVADNCGNSVLTTSGSNLEWSTTETTASITVTTAGDYTVTQTVDGCTSLPGTGTASPIAIPSTPIVTVADNCGNSVLTTSGSNLEWSTTETTASITVTTAGDYTVTQTVDGCTSLPGTGTASPLIVADISSGTIINPATCGSLSGSIEVLGNGTGNVNWTGANSGSATNVTLPYVISGLGAGSYNITFSDNCISNELIETLVDPNAPLAPIVTVADNCGNSVLTTSGSNLEWSTTETTASITVTTAGDYTVTQTVDGCTSLPGTGTASPIAIPSAPIVTVADNCGNSVLTTSGSNLEWSTTETTPSITVTAAGDYTVTQTVDGCTSLPGTGTASPIAIPSAPIVTVADNCGNSVLTTSGSNLEWSTTETTASITVTTAGDYTVTQTIDGCTSLPGTGTASPIAIPSTPIVTVADNCGNSVLTTSGSNLEWSTTETTASITVTTAGDYTVTQTIDGCTSLPGTGTASPIAIPSAPIVTVADNCGNSVLTTSGSNLEWSTTETTASITVTTASDYTVTQTVDGCTSLPGTGTASPIAIPSAPIVTVADNCGNSVLTTSGSNLEWSTTETTASITVTTAGDYTVTQTVDGCTSLPGTGTASPIAIPSAPIVTVADNCGNSVLTTSGSNLEWSTTETTASITVTTAGDYTVTQTVDGCTSLPGTGTASPIAIPSAPIVTVADNCGNSVLTTSGSNLEWSTTETTASITVTTAGDYTVTQTVDGCTSLPGTGTASPIAIPSAPIVTVADNCGNSVLTTSGSNLEWSTTETTASITVTTAGDYTVTQTVDGCTSLPGTGTASPLAIPSTPIVTVADNCGNSVLTTSGSNLEWSTTETTASITVTTAGDYTVTQTVDGCTSLPGTGTASPIAIPSTPIVTVADNCGNSVLTTSGSNLEWSTTETTASITVTTAGDYTVTQTVDGCTSLPGTGTASPLIVPTVLFDPLDQVCVYAEIFTLTEGSPSGGSYSGNGVIGDQFDPSVAGINTHELTYTYTAVNGCTNSASTEIIVDGCAILAEQSIETILIHPNPTNGRVTINTSSKLELIELFDATGRLVEVYNQFESDQFTLDMTLLEPAIYHLIVRTENGELVERVVKY